MSIDFNSETLTTKGRYGEDNNDPTVMRGKPTLNCGTFIQASGQAMLAPGDYIEVSIGTTIASTPGTPVYEPISRWVVTSNSLATAGNNKWSLKLELDRPNSSPNLILF